MSVIVLTNNSLLVFSIGGYVNNCQTGHNIEILIAKVYSMTADVHCEKICNQNLRKFHRRIQI